MWAYTRKSDSLDRVEIEREAIGEGKTESI